MSAEKQEEFKREFTHIKPLQGRRSTEYEDLTLHIQQDPQQDPRQFAWSGWTLLTPEGRGAWTVDSTALRCSDWWGFRDPTRTWQRTYVKVQAEQGKSLERLIETAKTRGLFTHFDPHWAQAILANHFAACTFMEYGIFRCFSYAQREALCDAIGNVCTFNAVDKMRYAQEVSLYGMELTQSLPGFSDAGAKQTWVTEPLWQGVRENMEKLMVLPDWGEMVVGINVVFEPLVGELVRSEFFLRFAPRNGDSVTPAIVESAELDWERNKKWTKAFTQLLLNDPAHAAHNRAVMQGWIDKWTSLSLKAARGLAPLFELPSAKPQTFAEAFASVQQGSAALIAEAGLSAPAEVRA
ncbi:MAG: methane monooxygenase [Candidatus Binatia bacterium]